MTWNKFKDFHNSHLIRESTHFTVSGVPDIMYFLPEEFPVADPGWGSRSLGSPPLSEVITSVIYHKFVN